MNELAARIYSEEDLQQLERMLDNMVLPTPFIACVVGAINSHRELFRANAELSFKNMNLEESK